MPSGNGPATPGSGEAVCPWFDTYAEYGTVIVAALPMPLQRATRQGAHWIVSYDKDYDMFRCACGNMFSTKDAQRRRVA